MTTATLIGRASRTADQVRTEADRFDPAKVFAVLLIIPFVVVGWTARKGFQAVWAVLSWVCGALLIGWRSAGGEGGPD